MPVLIALTGAAGCGKTTIANELEARGFVRVRFAGPLKSMLITLGLTRDQVDGNEKEVPCDLLCGKTPRWAMQSLGTNWGRVQIGHALWSRAALRIVRALLAEGKDVVIDDLRFDTEGEELVEENALIFKLERGPQPRFPRLRKFLSKLPIFRRYFHPSEAGVDSKFITATIKNNSSVEDALNSILNHIETFRLREVGDFPDG